MRKSVIAILLLVVILFVFTYSTAEELAEMTNDELLDLRLQINIELAGRKAEQEIPEDSTIADLFPDHFLAMKVRDAIGAISTNDPVTQEELDTIETISINGSVAGETNEFKDLTGIEYLRNLKTLRIVRQPEFTEIPDSIGSCMYLRVLDFRSCGIKTLPAVICDLTDLEEIDLAYSELESLPDDIGNLEQLKEIDISNTNVTALPESIRNLSLEKFRRDGLNLD